MNNKSSGFSLIEVMAAIVILTIAFFPIIAYFTNSIGFVSQREDLAEANNIAVNTIEFLKKKSETDWDNLDSYTYDSGITVAVNYLDKNLNSVSNGAVDAKGNRIDVLAEITVTVNIDGGISYQLNSFVNKVGG
jgi:prepilin-type N-terminal cleavage/methylation domain-containing protein